MNIQNIVSDVRSRVETAGRHYQDAFKAYVTAQRKAVGVVTKNGQTLANTEIGAAKNVFAAARASFDKARADGVRKVARSPQAYVPNGRDQIVSAYKDTIDLLVRTGNELTDVVSSGYKNVLGKLGNTPTTTTTAASASTKARRTTGATRRSSTTRRAASTTKSEPAKQATNPRRKTASTRKRAGTAASTTKTSGDKKTASSSASSTTAKKTGAATKSSPRKRKTSAKTSASQASAPAPAPASDNTSNNSAS